MRRIKINSINAVKLIHLVSPNTTIENLQSIILIVDYGYQQNTVAA
jgi:hypothetical protein